MLARLSGGKKSVVIRLSWLCCAFITAEIVSIGRLVGTSAPSLGRLTATMKDCPSKSDHQLLYERVSRSAGSRSGRCHAAGEERACTCMMHQSEAAIEN
jgi:hypothetical protein